MFAHLRGRHRSCCSQTTHTTDLPCLRVTCNEQVRREQRWASRSVHIHMQPSLGLGSGSGLGLGRPEASKRAMGAGLYLTENVQGKARQGREKKGGAQLMPARPACHAWLASSIIHLVSFPIRKSPAGKSEEVKDFKCPAAAGRCVFSCFGETACLDYPKLVPFSFSSGAAGLG